MSTARDDVFRAIRKSLGRAGGADPEALPEAVRERLAQHPRGLVPSRGQGDRAARIERFVAEAERVSASVARLSGMDAVPAAVAEYLARNNQPSELRMAPHPELAALPWADRPALEVRTGPSDGTDLVGLARAVAGVAETGTLMLASGPEGPTTVNFLPDTHIVVLCASEVVGAYEDAWDRLRTMRGGNGLPRAVNFVTGPSRTGDIQQTIYLGAHGPRRLHILLVEDG